MVEVLVIEPPAPAKLEAILYNSSLSPAAMGWNSLSRLSRVDLLVMILMSWGSSTVDETSDEAA